MPKEKTIDERELIRRISNTASVSVRAAGAALKTLGSAVRSGMRGSQTVSLVGVGTFSSTPFPAKRNRGRPNTFVVANEGVYFRGSTTLWVEGERFMRPRRSVAAIRPSSGIVNTPKFQLVAAVADDAGVTWDEAKRALDGVVEETRRSLIAGNNVQVGVLGVLSLHAASSIAGFSGRKGGGSQSSELTRQHPDLTGLDATSVAKSETTPPVTAVGKKQQYELVKVFYGTDRQASPNPKSPREHFGDARGHSVTYGFCEVSIPRKHKAGKLESPYFLKQFFQDPRKHVVLMRLAEYTEDVFISAISHAPHLSEKRRALVFVHGFNCSFEDAARRAAQIAYDVEFSGVPLVYSWPSAAATVGYVSDGSDAAQSASYFYEFILNILQKGGFDEVIIIAHSMGNRVLARAINLLQNKASNEDLKRLTELVLAAPDIDADVFRTQIAPLLQKLAISTTLYASSKDKALKASKVMNGYPRAGDSGDGILVLNGIETIDASNVDTSLFSLGHSYIGDAVRLTSDLYYLIEKGMRADVRHGLKKILGTLGPYWKFKR